MFRETPNGDFQLAYTALRVALEDLTDRRKHILSGVWMHKVLHAFKQKAKELIKKDKNQEINLNILLFPAKGKMSDHENELIEHILDKMSYFRLTSAGVITSWYVKTSI